ncbi:hypothetical protein F5887DRAFT_327746 [Amanita rubescens]|nr:hypothetical protein F5887DRAFT_327746 [Amanita rubescens]
MARAPKERKLNTMQCPECKTTVKYRSDVARHMKLHDQNREKLMVHCTYPGCEYKSLQKSNTVNHSRKHGFSKSWACPFSNCPFFTLYSRFMTQHLLDSHDLVRDVPRSMRSKKTVRSSTAPNQGGYGSSEQCAVEHSASTSSKPSVVGDIQQSRQPMITVPPAQLVPGYRFPFFPDSSYNPCNARPSYYYDANTPTVTMPRTQLRPLLPVPSQMPYAPQFRVPPGTYYTPDQPQMPIQQQIFTPTTSQMFFQDAVSPPLCSPSSVSSWSFSDNSFDMLAETPTFDGSSTTWENLSLTPAVDPSFMSSQMQNISTPYTEETSIMSASTCLFPHIGNTATAHMSTIPPPQDFNLDFTDLIL